MIRFNQSCKFRVVFVQIDGSREKLSPISMPNGSYRTSFQQDASILDRGWSAKLYLPSYLRLPNRDPL